MTVSIAQLERTAVRMKTTLPLHPRWAALSADEKQAIRIGFVVAELLGNDTVTDDGGGIDNLNP